MTNTINQVMTEIVDISVKLSYKLGKSYIFKNWNAIVKCSIFIIKKGLSGEINGKKGQSKCTGQPRY